MKELIKTVLSSIKPGLEAIVKLEARVAAWWARAAFRRLKAVQWALEPQPEHFDHRIDLYAQWRDTRNPLWLERGVFSGLALRPGGRVLELACGDGFSARNFFSIRSESVVACDFDPSAIATARAHNRAKNVTFVEADIRTQMPEGRFDNVVWDAAIEHFTPTEIAQVLQSIKDRLGDDGVLSGYTIVERSDGVKSLSHHEYEFQDKADLLRFLTPHFKQVTVFETVYPSRHNLYFWASDGTLPFAPGWASAITKSSE